MMSGFVKQPLANAHNMSHECAFLSWEEIEAEWVDAREAEVQHREQQGVGAVAAAASSARGDGQRSQLHAEWTVDSKGVFWLCHPDGIKTRLGRVTEVWVGTARHSLSFYCSLHRSCGTMKRAKCLPSDKATLNDRIASWLLQGQAQPNGVEHMKSFDSVVLEG